MKASSIKTRHQVAQEMMNSSGVDYFNPLIGESATDTFRNLNDSVGMLHFLLNQGELSEEIRGGLALYVQTIWSAVQFEMESGREVNGGAS